MEVALADAAGVGIAAVLTLFVFSYLLGDNVLYRLAEHIFVGVTFGYAAVLVVHQVLVPRLVIPLADLAHEWNASSLGDWRRLALLLVPLVLGLLLLTKARSRAGPVSRLGNVSVSLILGVGAALAIGGALLGTLLPQVDATADITRTTARYGPVLGLISGPVILVGAVGVLLHFHASRGGDNPLAGARDRLVQVWGRLGRWFVLIAFAGILATTFMSRLSLLIGRIQFLLQSIGTWFGG